MVGTEIGTGIDAILGGNDWGGALGSLEEKSMGSVLSLLALGNVLATRTPVCG